MASLTTILREPVVPLAARDHYNVARVTRLSATGCQHKVPRRRVVGCGRRGQPDITRVTTRARHDIYSAANAACSGAARPDNDTATRAAACRRAS